MELWWLTTSSCSLLLIYWPRKDERLSWLSWLTYSGRFTHISGHPSAVGPAQDSESSPVKDQRSTAEPRNQLWPGSQMVIFESRFTFFQAVSLLVEFWRCGCCCISQIKAAFHYSSQLQTWSKTWFQPGFPEVRVGLRHALDFFLSKTWSQTCCINPDMLTCLQHAARRSSTRFAAS